MSPFVARFGRALAASILLLVFVGASGVLGAAGDIGHKDGSYGSGGSAPSGSKPESKLWYNDGFWWASIRTQTGGFFIHRLDPNTDSWVNTNVPLDNRRSSRADTLWDGTKLYVASQVFSDAASTQTGSNGEARLYRFSYNSGSHTYTLDSGFPAIIRSGWKTETLTIAKDSTGMLWATWVQQNLVKVNHSTTNDQTWSAPVTLPVGGQPVGVTVDSDDISTIIAFKPSGQTARIGVLWSNQVDSKDYFAWRTDGTPDTTVWTAEQAIAPSGGNPNPADDHLNIKADSSGRLYAAVKNSNDSSGQPQIELLVRQPGGGWSANVVSTGTVHTRPIVELDESAGMLHVFLTGPTPPDTTGDSGGTIYEKTSSTSSISFAAGLGTPVIRDAALAGNGQNNPTSTKQNVSSSTGIVVLSSADPTRFYWHATEGIGPAQDPQASFTAQPTSGTATLNVQFTNTSTGTGTLTSTWDFDNDGTVDDTSTNPSHAYTSPGTYTAKLTVTGTNGSNSTTRQIQVDPPAGPTATFTPDADAQVKSSSATANYGALNQLQTREDPGTGPTYRSYLRFNVTGLTGQVLSAKLRLYTTDTSTDIQSVLNTVTNPNWIETGTGSITWNNAPSIGSTVLGSSSVPTVNAYNEITLSPSAVTGNGLVTFAIRSSGTNSAIFNSKEGANDPQLVITQAQAGTAPTANATSATVGEDGSGPVALSGSDPETCDLTFSIVTPPAHGALGAITNNACGSGSPNTDSASVTYTPAANYSGPDQFTYKVNDGTADSSSATATLSVTGSNDLPTANAVNATASIGTPKTITLSGGDVETCDLTFTIVSPPSSGSLGNGGIPTNQPCAGSGPYTDSATIAYTAASGTSDSFTYKVTDGNAADSSTATVTITITAPNTVPTADATSATVGEDGSGPVALSGSDPETCELTFSIVTPPAHGNLGSIGNNGCAGGGPFTDSASVTYTPAANYNGGDSFTYKINDGTDDSTPATATLTVTSVNDLPTANATSASTPQNTAKTITLSGADVETCDLTFSFGQPAHGTVSSPTNAACAGTGPYTDTGTVLYTPNNGYTGPDAFTYKVTDGDAADSPNATVTITVTGGSPTTTTLNPVADSQVQSGSVNGNYGTLTPFRTREGSDPVYRLFFKFDLSSVSGTVQSAKLRLFVTTPAASNQTAYAVSDTTWTETGITWANAPAIGAAGPSAVSGSTAGYIEIPVSVSAIHAGALTSLAVEGSTTKSVYFNSRESSTNKPELVIVTQ